MRYFLDKYLEVVRTEAPLAVFNSWVDDMRKAHERGDEIASSALHELYSKHIGDAAMKIVPNAEGMELD